MQETPVWFLGWEDPLEKGKATHSSILAWRIPWTEQSRGSQRVRRDWATITFHFHFQAVCWVNVLQTGHQGLRLGGKQSIHSALVLLSPERIDKRKKKWRKGWGEVNQQLQLTLWEAGQAAKALTVVTGPTVYAMLPAHKTNAFTSLLCRSLCWVIESVQQKFLKSASSYTYILLSYCCCCCCCQVASVVSDSATP